MRHTCVCLQLGVGGRVSQGEWVMVGPGEGPGGATPAVSLSPCLPPHSSAQIDELYESYCVQRRLRDGAYNMVRAYSTSSPGSREARDSLAEATRGHREYTEVRGVCP